tara:strand:- start:4870 stop:4974 length:105 start_codon:yes stop_codon:yes gene_type:complete
MDSEEIHALIIEEDTEDHSVAEIIRINEVLLKTE